MSDQVRAFERRLMAVLNDLARRKLMLTRDALDLEPDERQHIESAVRAAICCGYGYAAERVRVSVAFDAAQRRCDISFYDVRAGRRFEDSAELFAAVRGEQ